MSEKEDFKSQIKSLERQIEEGMKLNRYNDLVRQKVVLIKREIEKVKKEVDRLNS